MSLSCVLKQVFQVAQKIYETRCYNTRVKGHYFTKVPLRLLNILSILGVINANAIILLGFYKNKIRLLCLFDIYIYIYMLFTVKAFIMSF
jgi:hypothetical protein